MEAKGFLGSLFDYSFGSYITPKIIKVLYVLATVLVALWTLALVLIAFNVSSGFGVFTLLILAPFYFVVAMIYARVFLELLSAFFHIHDDVKEIKQRTGGTGGVPVEPAPTPTPLDPAPVEVAPEAVPVASQAPVVASEPTAWAAEEEPFAGTTVSTLEAPEPPPTPETLVAADSSAETVRYCENCGAERRPGGRFCTSCGHA